MRWPLILVVAGNLLALVPVGLGLPDLPVPLPFLPMVAGVLWAWIAWSKDGKKKLLWGAILCTAIAGAYAGWFFGLSTYRDQKGVPAEGSLAPDIDAVRVRDGARFRLGSLRGQSIVLVFFRGAW